MKENKKSRNKHAVPVPRVFKIASNLFTKVCNGESLNSLIYSVNHRNIKGIYALVCNAKRNDSLLDEILMESGLKNEKMDGALAKILVAELLWGKQHLAGDSKPIKTTLSYKSKLEAAAEASSIPVSRDEVVKPRFARVNTILTTVEGTIRRLEDDGWILMDTPDSYEEFLGSVLKLNEDEFMKDFHFDDVLVFTPKAQSFDNILFENGSLIRQDKASCLPPRLLNPPPGSTVLDVCAAPGLKTSHLAQLMKNKGTLYAVDIDQKRFNLMNSQITKFCGMHNCVVTLCKDSILLTGKECPKVKYIMIDPSCTGTGMTKRIEDKEDVTANVTSKRIEKLSNFQVRLLVQALTEFPDVERVVYSTCSLLEEENEQVIQQALSKVPEFHVVPTKIEKWERTGNAEYDFGPHCLVADLEHDLTNGFFVAVLERKKKKNKNDEEPPILESNDSEGKWQMPKKRLIKRKSNVSNKSVNKKDESMAVDSEDVLKKKQKKK